MSIQQNKFKTIADTIRACLGTEDSISPSSFAEKVSAVNETAYDKGYENGLEKADGVKMACGYVQGSNSGTFSVSGLGFKPKDIRILPFSSIYGIYKVKRLVWKESAGGKCITTDGSNDGNYLNDAIVTTTDDGFSAKSGGTKPASFFEEDYFYWFAFAEEQEGGYV
ncbi:MAG: hypothetical protein II996_03285 [Oscillospiraceae bacterium]|nr:hypothetical protein [Oscillospiraceae bacterium]